MKRFFALLGVLCLALGLAGGVLADDEPTPQPPQNVNATLEIIGGTLAITPLEIEFEDTSLTGKSIEDIPGTTLGNWGMVDPTGTGAGYHVNISATNFESAQGHTIPVDGFGMTLLQSNIIALDDHNGEAPVSNFATEQMLSTGVKALLSADEGTGQGSWELAPSFTLDVPADAYAGSYTSTVTVAIVTGP